MNIARDYANNVDLKLAGWRVIRIWECEVLTKANREETLNRLYTHVTQTQNPVHYQTNEIDSASIAAEPHITYGEDLTILI